MADPVAKSRWGGRLTWLALLLSIGAVAASLIAAVGSGQGVWHFRPAFTVLTWSFYAAIAAALAAVVALFLNRRGDRRGANLLALAVALGFVAYLGNQLATARSVPAIHDVTTDLEDVPDFRALQVRPDNLENIPDEGKAELAALSPEERWKALHRRAYSDIRPLHVPWTVQETIGRARTVAEDRGWEIAHFDPHAGRLEATATTFFFRFKDDVVIRARRNPKGGTIVDMRSISRVGGSDVGMNAKRIREYLADLKRA